ncbi:hypothetical protein CEUSTIGMA_g3863.t1 [Chlamydomonas eustigma]|uniref:Uncharacterized protein n=1 Tax=Chlamydomonas eustigma TaxID=1157962 RepID=A0A250X022_9CHLO|nr:hypothetical protein CEUSTIGMA_g3863.t1 [Chlamydomonas eustigma]|eukprot:GAX76418.1 hypothetical protein CEUSTIGMA_g3863.t1 [Chlamydomonas eustigma]
MDPFEKGDAPSSESTRLLSNPAGGASYTTLPPAPVQHPAQGFPAYDPFLSATTAQPFHNRGPPGSYAPLPPAQLQYPPATQQSIHAGDSNPMNSGLCKCLSHYPTCCYAWLANPCLWAESAEIITEEPGSFCKHMWTFSCSRILAGALVAIPLAFCGSPPGSELLIYAAAWAATGYVGGSMRRRFRAKYGLPEAPCNDYLVYALCPCCASAEEARKLRGL